MLKVQLTGLLLCLNFLGTTGYALDSREANIYAAQQASESAQFEEAIRNYENVLDTEIKNGHLYYNLGHSYFRIGQKGLAMASFLAAKRFLPRDPDVDSNLKFVHKSIEDKLNYMIEKPAWMIAFFWLDWLTGKEQLYAVAIIFGLCCLIWCGALLKESLESIKIFAYVGILFSAILLLGWSIHRNHYNDWGAITSSLAKAYSGPSERNNSVVFQLHEGAPIAFLDEKRGWLKIQISDGKKGWILSEDATIY